MRRVLVAGLLLLVAGCSSGTTKQGGVVDCGTAGPNVVTVTTAYQNDKADPSPKRIPVKAGNTVQITVTSDKAAEIHIHGYDFEYDADPGKATCKQFVADRAGLFDVEAHPDTLLFQLEVR